MVRATVVTCGVEWVVDQARAKRLYVHCCRNEGASRKGVGQKRMKGRQQGKDPRREELVEGTARTCGRRGKSCFYEGGPANGALGPRADSRGVKRPVEASGSQHARGCGQPVERRAWQLRRNRQEEIPAEAQLTVFRVANEAGERARPPMCLTLAVLPSSVLTPVRRQASSLGCEDLHAWTDDLPAWSRRDDLPALALALAWPACAHPLRLRASTTAHLIPEIASQQHQMNTRDPRVPRGITQLLIPFCAQTPGVWNSASSGCLWRSAQIVATPSGPPMRRPCHGVAISSAQNQNPQSPANLHYQRLATILPLRLERCRLVIRRGPSSPLSGG